MSLFADIHAVQSVPPSNLNRDENGSPKTAIYGGVRRHRVSSQAWKKSIRDYYNENFAGDNRSFRTKNVASLVTTELLRLKPELEEVEAKAQVRAALVTLKIIGAKGAEKEGASNDALFLISQKQIEGIALGLSEGNDTKALSASLAQSNSLDLALFGRMVAENKNLNVEAACQFAHALSTHAVANEFDYFTAADDFSETDHAGAAMIGDIEFNSSTLYRFASINVSELSKSFSADAEVVAKAISNFLEAFVRAIPSGKQNSFAARTLPSLLLVTLRSDQPTSYAGAFEKPVVALGDGNITPSIVALANHAAELKEAYGDDSAKTFAVVIDSNSDSAEAVAKIATILNLKDLESAVVAEMTKQIAGSDS